MTGRKIHRIDELARDIPPARDLWPGIAAAIEADKAANAGATLQNRRSRWLPAVGMAAAVGLVAIGVLIGHAVTPRQPLPPIARTATVADTGVIPAALRDAEYRKQRDELLRDVKEKLQGMPQAERDKVSASLDTLQKSILEIQAALGHDPANALLQELLVSSCQEQMRALTAVRDSGRQET
jgi:N-acyl-D-aspartate/D-glutamate deacylase